MGSFHNEKLIDLVYASRLDLSGQRNVGRCDGLGCGYDGTCKDPESGREPSFGT
jgi:hypothetical protein